MTHNWPHPPFAFSTASAGLLHKLPLLCRALFFIYVLIFRQLFLAMCMNERRNRCIKRRWSRSIVDIGMITVESTTM